MTIANIKGFLLDKNITEALAVYRAARWEIPNLVYFGLNDNENFSTIWPDGPFGTVEIEPEEELLGLREIYFSKTEGLTN